VYAKPSFLANEICRRRAVRIAVVDDAGGVLRAGVRERHRGEIERENRRRSDEAPRHLAAAEAPSVPPAGNTTTFAPAGTRRYKSMTSWFIIRMQPDDMARPIDDGSFVP
jgi:hypothetical protein